MATRTKGGSRKRVPVRARGKRGHGSIERRGSKWLLVLWGKDERGKRVREALLGEYDTQAEAREARSRFAEREARVTDSGTLRDWAEGHWLILRAAAEPTDSARMVLRTRWRLIEHATWYDRVPAEEVSADHVVQWIEHMSRLTSQTGKPY